MSPHPSSTRLRAFAACSFVILCLSASFVCFLPPRDVSDGVRLRLTTPHLDPASGLALVFETDMVPAASVDTVAMESPLVIEPMLKGSFRWLGSREGVYALHEAPRLGTEYRFRLATGLRDATGKVADACLVRRLTTPAFDVANVRTSFRTVTGNSSRPVVHLAFVDAVAPEAIAAFCEFTDGTVRRPATVSAFAGEELPGYRVEGNLGLDHRRIQNAWSPARSAPDETVRNAVRVEPAGLLPAGADWRLVLRAGLPSVTGGVSLKEERVIRIGEVRGMQVLDVAPFSSYTAGRRIEAHLTLDPTGEPHEGWVLVEPRPDHFTVQRRYRTVTLGGDFELDRDYRVTVRAGLMGRRGDELARDFTATVRFKPLPPRVMLPAADEVQYASGGGRLEFLTCNADRVRVRARRIEPDQLIHVLEGYRGRMRNDEGERDYPFGLVPGRELPGETINTQAPVDEARRNVVDLRRLAGGAGAVFVDVQPLQEGGRVGAQALVQLTDLGLLWKRHTDGWQFRVFSLVDGRPVARARVSLVSDGNETLAVERCNREGIANLPALQAARWVKVVNGDDVLALPLHAGRLHPYGMGVPTTWRLPERDEAKLFLFTDRPVYEPGDEVHLKGIARWSGDGLRLPDGTQPVVATLFDSRGSAVVRTNLPLNTAGSFAWNFSAPDKRVGRHRLTVELAGDEETISFLVQHHEPDAFEVVLGGENELPPDADVTVPVTARYLFGSAVTDAKVKWVIESREQRFEPADFAGFVFGEHVSVGQLSRGFDIHIAKGETAVTPAGPALVATKLPSAIHPRLVNVEAEVTDLNQQTIIGRKSVLAHASDFYLGIERPSRHLRVGESPTLAIAAVDFGGSVRTQTAAVGWRLDKINWNSMRIAGAGGSIDYRSECRLAEVTTNVLSVVGRSELRLPELPETGQYLLTLNARDTSGLRVETRMTFSVIGAEAAAWDYHNAAQLQLKPDRESYQPGDTAELLVESPIDGTALVTVERDRVHYSFTTNIAGGAPVIHVPLRREDAPNVFASVTLVRGGEDSRRQHPEPEFRYGFAQLKVDSPTTRLDVQLATDREECRPGETVRVTCRVRNHRGRPERDVEVTLYAVDEGVLKLTGATVPDPHNFFHAIRPLAVQSHLSLIRLMPEDPADLRFHNKGYLIGGGGRLLGGARENFVACPLWQPHLKTDRHGEVSAEFRGPDNLTRYRVIAVVHAGAERFGGATTTVVVNKPLLVEPVLPAFARVGDHIDCRALIVNRTATAGEVVVTRRPGGETRQVAVPAGGARTVGFPTTFTDVGRVEWTWTARFTDSRGDAMQDTVKSALDVEEAMPRRQQIALGRVSGTTNLLATIDPALVKAGARAELWLSTSPLLEAHAGIDQLLHYPYGCVEQTSSSLLPWLSVARAPGLGKLIQKTDAEIAIATAAGIKRLFSMQTSDGGLSYWPGGTESMFWGSAYAVSVLTQTESLPAEEWAALLDYLRGKLLATEPRSGPLFDQSHALALYALALAGRPLPELHRRLHDQRETLTAEACALVALAEWHSERRTGLMRELLTAGNKKNDQRYFASAQRRLAIEAMAWRGIDPAIGEARLRALFARRENGQWTTTQGNAWALLALVSGQRADAPPSISGQLDAGGFELEDGGLFERSLSLGDRTRWDLRLAGSGTAYAQVRVSAPIDPATPPETNRGFELVRSYERLNGPGAWRVGDSILVTLQLTTKEAAGYVAIDDPLPSLLEAIVPEFKSRRVAAAQGDSDWFSSYRELRRDRALFFRDHLPAGEHRIRYVARVRASGRAIAPPAKVERMYAPDLYGASATEQVEVAQ